MGSSGELSALLQRCGLTKLLPTFEDEELSVSLLGSMSDLSGTLAELGVSAADRRAVACCRRRKR